MTVDFAELMTTTPPPFNNVLDPTLIAKQLLLIKQTNWNTNYDLAGRFI